MLPLRSPNAVERIILIDMRRLESSTKWILFSIIYAASLVPVIIAGMVVAGIVERFLGCGYACEVGGGLTLLVVGVVVFSLLTTLFIRSEHAEAPQSRDHLRLCSVVYAIMVILALYLIVDYAAARHSLGYGLAIALFLLAGYAAFVNAIAVYVVRQRALERSP